MNRLPVPARDKRMVLAINVPDFGRHVDALHAVCSRRQRHVIVVQTVPLRGEAALVLSGNRAGHAVGKLAHDPVWVVRVGDRQCDPVNLPRRVGKLKGDRDPGPGGQAEQRDRGQGAEQRAE